MPVRSQFIELYMTFVSTYVGMECHYFRKMCRVSAVICVGVVSTCYYMYDYMSPVFPCLN